MDSSMKNKKGMTLVEVVVAIGLFGIIMVTIFPAFLVLNLINNVSYENTDATYVAQNIMEQMINISNTDGLLQDALDSLSGYTCSDSNVEPVVCTVDQDRYVVSVTFSENITYNNLTNVLIVVNGVKGEAQGERAQLETMVAFQ